MDPFMRGDMRPGLDKKIVDFLGARVLPPDPVVECPALVMRPVAMERCARVDYPRWLLRLYQEEVSRCTKSVSFAFAGGMDAAMVTCLEDAGASLELLKVPPVAWCRCMFDFYAILPGTGKSLPTTKWVWARERRGQCSAAWRWWQEP